MFRAKCFIHWDQGMYGFDLLTNNYDISLKAPIRAKTHRPSRLSTVLDGEMEG